MGYPPSRRSARVPARWCRRNGGRHRRFRSRSIAGLEERDRSAAEDWLGWGGGGGWAGGAGWCGSAAAADWLGRAAAEDWPEPGADWLGPIAVRFPSRA